MKIVIIHRTINVLEKVSIPQKVKNNKNKYLDFTFVKENTKVIPMIHANPAAFGSKKYTQIRYLRR